jgi:hypothetical protein
MSPGVRLAVAAVAPVAATFARAEPLLAAPRAVLFRSKLRSL